MPLLNAPLGVVAGIAKILTALPARDATRMRTRATHHQHSEIAPLQLGDSRSGLDHFSERLVADHKIFRAFRRSAVLKGHDVLVRPADTHIAHTDFDLRGGFQLWLRMIDDLDLAPARKYSDRLHIFRIAIRRL